MAFSTLLLRQLLGEAERFNIGRNALLAGVVDAARLQQEDFWIEDGAYFEVVERTLCASPFPTSGLRLGQRGSFAALGAPGLHLAIVPTLRQALESMVAFEHVVCDAPVFFLSEDEHCLRTELSQLDAPVRVREFMTEMLLRSISELVAQFGGPGARPRRILFDYPRPRHFADYRAAFGCEIVFEQPRAGIEIDLAVAERVQLSAQPELADQLRLIAERQSFGRRARGIAGQVRAQLRRSSGHALPSMVQVARCLGLSERSLRRQLAREGSDFRAIVGEERHELAKRMLAHQGAVMKQVAHEVGYGSASAFHRAFKRWTGDSPSSYAAEVAGPPRQDGHDADQRRAGNE